MFRDIVIGQGLKLVHCVAIYLNLGTGMSIASDSCVDMVTLMRLFGEKVGSENSGKGFYGLRRAMKCFQGVMMGIGLMRCWLESDLGVSRIEIRWCL